MQLHHQLVNGMDEVVVGEAVVVGCAVIVEQFVVVVAAIFE